ncbi:uncharacterized protein AB675_2157 [Cyphellophora attinorum]|uniref:Putative membrane protein n=1 Tax=Cyphellophora attinorum TaxID=1664694 RepID=A0A0N1P0N4_9EURO|nr:uncharacterized protein AB675_2157 [Phialophora attinorum]KPI43054.1 putative membrane protein [Phialophora attinorum]
MASSTLYSLVRRQQNKQDAAQNTSNSASSLVSTLVPTILIAAAIFIVFLVLRNKLARVFQARTFDGLVAKDAQTPAPKTSFLGWLSDYRQLSDEHILQHSSLDNYFFVRYLKMLMVIAFVGCCVTWPILFPVNATGKGGQKQLDLLSMSNIANPNRYYAHALTAWVFFGFVLFVVVRESLYFIGVRQAYFMTSFHAQRLSSRTVLFLGIPKESLSEQALRQVFGHHVRKIWIVPDCEKLEDKIEDRDDLWNKLETGEMKLIINENKKAQKQAKKKGASANPTNPSDPLASVGKKDWPTHKLKFLIGKKVDTIQYGRAELPKLNKDIQEMQNEHFDGRGKSSSAAFVEFSSQAAAQEAMQFTENKKKKTKFSPRYIQVHPEQVIWKNLAMSKASRKLKMALATTVVTLMTIFWAIPVAFVGSLSNVNYLTNELPWLGFINSIPDVILGVVTGLLPVVLLAVLVALVPIICRQLAKFAGAPTLAVVESKTQSWYFIFQVIQVFLITTFSSAASSVVTQIVQNPGSAVNLLAKNLPKASNFYISYFILQGLMIFALQILNIAGLLSIYVLGKILGKTPRKQYTRWMQLIGLGWGSEYPKITNMGVIMLSYSCIAPLVLGFATIGFALMYLGFRYQFLFVLGLKVDMNGEGYLKALRQLLVGLYLATWCLIGLFAISVGDSRAAIGPLVLMVVFLVVLIVCNVLVNAGLKPLESNIPLDLLAGNQASRVLSAESTEEGHGYDSDDTRADPNALHNTSNGAPIVNKGERAQPQNEWQPSVPKDKRKSNFLTSRFENAIDKSRAKATYMHPALAAPKKDMVVWLAQDKLGISRELVRGNKEAGINSTDEFAWLNEKNKVEWDTTQPEKVPIYDEVRYW